MGRNDKERYYMVHLEVEGEWNRIKRHDIEQNPVILAPSQSSAKSADGRCALSMV